MKNVSHGAVDGKRSGTEWPLRLRWGRILLATVAVHVLGTSLSVVSIVAYSVVTMGAPVEGFAGTLSTWILPVLTLPAATWTTRGMLRAPAVTQGLIVGLLVAGTLGLLFFWPYDPRSLTLFAVIVAAGLAGGLLERGVKYAP